MNKFISKFSVFVMAVMFLVLGAANTVSAASKYGQPVTKIDKKFVMKFNVYACKNSQNQFVVSLVNLGTADYRLKFSESYAIKANKARTKIQFTQKRDAGTADFHSFGYVNMNKSSTITRKDINTVAQIRTNKVDLATAKKTKLSLKFVNDKYPDKEGVVTFSSSYYNLPTCTF